MATLAAIRRRVSASSSSPAKRSCSHGGMRGAAARREAQHLREAGDRQDARDDRRGDARGGAAIAKAQERVRVVEELRDRAARARVDLALEVVEVRLRRSAPRGALPDRRRPRSRTAATRARPGDQVGRKGEAIRVRPVAVVAVRRVTAQRDQVADALVPVAARDVEDLLAWRADAGEVRRAGERGLALDAASPPCACARASSRRRRT